MLPPSHNYEHNKNVAIYKPRREPSPELCHTGTFIATFHLQVCEKSNVCSLTHPVYGIWLQQPELMETTPFSISMSYLLNKLFKLDYYC